jgi:hypothetical protein
VALLTALTVAALVTVAGAASTGAVQVARLLRSRLALVRHHDGSVPVLLPSTMLLGSPDYATSSASRGSYRLEIDGAKPCKGANVCLYALFTGVRGASHSGVSVRLAHGIHGSFAGIRCGAACSPASISWVERGVLYTIEANPAIASQPNVSAGAFDRIFVDAANQAIEDGPR